METIGIKISQIRKQKALSQEQLAEISKVNVRTIQRIENNETTPRGTTLKLICDALEVSPQEMMNFEKTKDNSLLIWLHLSVLLGYVLPLGNLILPLILWLTNKNHIEDVDKLGKNILNFQIFYSILISVIVFVGALFRIIHLTSYFNLVDVIMIAAILGTLNFIYPIINAIRISRGTIKKFYPTLIRFIK